MPLRISAPVVAAACLSGSFFCLTSWAQTAPDAGALRQQIEQQRAPALPNVTPRPAPEAKAPVLKGGATVHVQAFAFAGNRLLAPTQLDTVLRDFLGKDLEFAGLQAACDAVAAAYRAAGWLARVYLPEQDVSGGTIRLQVVEAQFAGVRFEGQASARVRPEVVAAYFDAVQAQGQALNADALDRALMLADDLPGVSLAGTLAAGQGDAETALVLRTNDEPLWFGSLTTDNAGARATGASRLLLNLGLNSPGGRGESLSLNAMRTEGSEYGALSLTVPVGAKGLRAGLSLSDMSYQVIEGVGAATTTPIRGHSSSLGLDLNYPVLRARMHNLYASASLSNKGFRNQDSALRSDYATNSLSLGLSGNRFDAWGGGGANAASLTWSTGQLSDVIAHSQIDSMPRRFHKLSYNLSRQQQVTATQSVLLNWAGQYSGGVLDSSEKFYIGGAQSVRAYPASELSGDRGQSLSAEWRWRVRPEWVLSAFVDMGRVQTLPTQPGDATLKQALYGRGLSVSWQAPHNISTRLTWSRRNGANPQPTSSGTDGDGTFKQDRFWFSASKSF